MCQMSLTLVQALGAVLLLPPVLSPHLLLWLTGVVVPLLSLTLICNPIDLQVAKMAQSKRAESLSQQVGSYLRFVRKLFYFFHVQQTYYTAVGSVFSWNILKYVSS